MKLAGEAEASGLIKTRFFNRLFFGHQSVALKFFSLNFIPKKLPRPDFDEIVKVD